VVCNIIFHYKSMFFFQSSLSLAMMHFIRSLMRFVVIRPLSVLHLVTSPSNAVSVGARIIDLEMTGTFLHSLFFSSIEHFGLNIGCRVTACESLIYEWV